MAERKIIAVAAEDDRGLEGGVSMHFGRCPAYVLVEVEDGRIESSRVVANPHYGSHQPGIMPQFISELGADVILAGGMGPRAIALFQSMGIETATGAVGNVQRVVDAYLQGRLRGSGPCEHDHAEGCGGAGS